MTKIVQHATARDQHSSIRMPHTAVRLGFCVMIIMIAVVSLSIPIRAQPGGTTQSTGEPYRTVIVELLRVEGRYYVVKDEHGKEMHLLISPDTRTGGTFKPGDRIEVEASPIEHAMFIRPLSKVHAEIDLEAATRTIRGRLQKIEGKYYVLKDENGREFRLLVTASTEMAGMFKAGDDLEVAVSPVEHAMSIRGIAADTR